jgi:hypothetical protein
VTLDHPNGGAGTSVDGDSVWTVATAAQLTAAPTSAAWTISRDGDPVAHVSFRHEGGGVVVSADLTGPGAAPRSPSRFETLRAAEEFVNDLIASFTYLGCDVSRS